MFMTLNDGDMKAAPDQAAARVMYSVAEKLHDHGIAVRFPAYSDGRRLTIVNARRARSEITAEDCGYVTWDYWPWSGSGTPPADVAGLVLAVLGAQSAGAHPAGPAPAAPGPAAACALTLKGAVGQALRAHGLDVTMAIYPDDLAFDVTAVIVAANPAVPSCGRVRVTDDGCITWECHHDGPPAECALAVADTIVPVLTHGIGSAG